MKIKTLTAIASIAFLGIFGGIKAGAATVDDVAAAARAKGVSESIIQSAYNRYYSNPDEYTAEDFDGAIIALQYYEDDLNALLSDMFGVDVTATSPSGTTAAAPDKNTVTTTSASSRPIEPADFIAMTLEEKMAFVKTLPPDVAQEFMNSLTNEERNSILKQAPPADMAEVLKSFLDASDKLGFQVDINDIDKGVVEFSVRDKKTGKLIDASALGITVEDTGHDCRLLFAVAGGIIVTASAGIAVIANSLKGKENE